MLKTLSLIPLLSCALLVACQPATDIKGDLKAKALQSCGAEDANCKTQVEAQFEGCLTQSKTEWDAYIKSDKNTEKETLDAFSKQFYACFKAKDGTSLFNKPSAQEASVPDTGIAVDMLKTNLKNSCASFGEACLPAFEKHFDPCFKNSKAEWDALLSSSEAEAPALKDAFYKKLFACIVDDKGQPVFKN